MDKPTSIEQVKDLISQGKKKKARELLRKIAKVDPKNEEVYILFAQVAQKRKHAIYALERALKINPNNMNARLHLGTMRSSSGANRTGRMTIGVAGFLAIVVVAIITLTYIRSSSNGSLTNEQQDIAADRPTETELGFTEAERKQIADGPTETKFGFTEAERKQIWEDLIRAEDRADVVAIRKYPNMTPYNDWRNLFDEFANLYKSELARELGLTLEQLTEIGYEAMEKDWPFPPLP